MNPAQISIMKMNEVDLQRYVHKILSDPATVRSSERAKRLQVLSPGRINVHGGPDFLDIALLLDGMVIIGDAEFHKKSSDWLEHNHNDDARYNNVILHIVIENNARFINAPFETLIINEKELEEAVHSESAKALEPDISSLEELQHYALLRLLRKTSEAQKLLNQAGLEQALIIIVNQFIGKYNNRRKRPVYDDNKLDELISNLPESQAFYFLDELASGLQIHIPDRIHGLLKQKFGAEGPHLRREIILNCVLPIALCLANEESRINLFLWYWSTPALHSYGLLNRKFTGLPQNFLWQQQGMLEYIKEHGRKTNVVAEAIKDYGFAEVLSFYRLGRAPFNDYALQFESE